MGDERIEVDLEKLDNALARWKEHVTGRGAMTDSERDLLEAMGSSAEPRPPEASSVRSTDRPKVCGDVEANAVVVMCGDCGAMKQAGKPHAYDRDVDRFTDTKLLARSER